MPGNRGTTLYGRPSDYRAGRAWLRKIALLSGVAIAVVTVPAVAVLALRSIPSVPVPGLRQPVSVLWLFFALAVGAGSARLAAGVAERRRSEREPPWKREIVVIYQALRGHEAEIDMLKRRIAELEAEE